MSLTLCDQFERTGHQIQAGREEDVVTCRRKGNFPFGVRVLTVVKIHATREARLELCAGLPQRRAGKIRGRSRNV